ncbi:MAG TPA: bifunctional phosphoribosylaminoimidazolecarboxamide formyltransferase/IMP cyclohydrolase [Thermoanaerobaculia bacterium]|nr:bifunctional phosphoribosylaminoimidazolecarboxamide formyltransferase/IMP cyclohydrolase [Thermoanaerobaculia bacterium]
MSEKSGVDELARGLAELGFEILSTGGTLRHLQEHGVPATSVAAVTGSAEILDGRVKTLHPRIHGAILADRGKESHRRELAEQGIVPIDVVVVNLYPFEQTLSRAGASAATGDPAELIEKIDIGGPTMTRAAAKNYRDVVVVVDPADYEEVLAALRAGRGTAPEPLRERLARKAFRHTQEYDAAIARWLESREAGIGATAGAGAGSSAPGVAGAHGVAGAGTAGLDAAPPEAATPATGPRTEAERFPERISLELVREFEPRYGENPHQPAAVYRTVGAGGLVGFMQKLQGKELSWNNMLDADAARKLVALFAEPSVVIVKHNNPCGVGRGTELDLAYRRALECDPVSAFGSIVALNRPASGELAAAMRDLFVEVVIAPGFSREALEIYGRKKNLRLIEAPPYRLGPSDAELRGIDGGFLAQRPDGEPEDSAAWRTVTRRKPSAAELRALEFAWKVTRYVKSNAIVLANGDQTVGIGAGQMSRVDSCRLAIQKAVIPTKGSVAGSDAFFPFRDGVDVLADAGVSAIAQPGGSVRDEEVIAACDQRGLAMVLTDRRHFRH